PMVERGPRVEPFHVVPTETGAGKAPVLFRIGLLLFAIGVAQAVAGGEASLLGVDPLMPDTGIRNVPVQNASIIVSIPAPARIPEEPRRDVPFIASANERIGNVERRVRLDKGRRRVGWCASDRKLEARCHHEEAVV